MLVLHWHLNDTKRFITLRTQSWIFINIDISLTHAQWMLSAKWYVIMCFIFNVVSKMMLQCISLLHFISMDVSKIIWQCVFCVQWMMSAKWCYNVCVMLDVSKMMSHVCIKCTCSVDDVSKMMLQCVFYIGCQQNDVTCVY